MSDADAATTMTIDFSDLAQPGLHRKYFSLDGYRRKIICQVPEDAPPGHPLPLVFFLHGAGGNVEQALHTYGWAEKAQAEKFIVVFLEGLGARPRLPGNFVLNPNIWRDGRPQQPHPEIDDIGFFSAVLDGMERTLPVDRHRIHLTGFSNGAAMTFTLAAKFADRISAIAPVATQSFTAETILPRAVPLYYLVNLADPLVPYAGGAGSLPWGSTVEHEPVQATLDQWLRLNGCSATSLTMSEHNGFTVTTYGTDPSRPLIVFTRIAGNGHHWPGTVEPLPESISGPRLDPFRATDAIWNFFAAQPGPPRADQK